MKTQVLKYWRIADDKKSILLLPSKVGVDIIKKYLDEAKIPFVETVEKLGNQSLIALQVDFESEYKYLKYELGLAGNRINLYIFTQKEKKFYLNFPFEI